MLPIDTACALTSHVLNSDFSALLGLFVAMMSAVLAIDV